MKRYRGEHSKKISFPIGGIGTGCIGISGSGRFCDWEIFNRPNKMSFNGMSHIAVKAVKNGSVVDVRVLNGDFLGDRTGSPDNFGFGPKRESMAGVPHFSSCEFQGQYPFAKLLFSDEKFPGEIELIAFNPLIPLNERDSSIPCAMFEIRIRNASPEPIDYSVVWVVDNPWAKGKRNQFSNEQSISMMTLKNGSVDRGHVDYGDITIATDSSRVSYQTNWFRGHWFDSLGVYWRELNSPSAFKDRDYGHLDDATVPGGIRDASGHAVLDSSHQTAPGETAVARNVLSWNVPNCCNYWDQSLNETELESVGVKNQWKNYYSTQWSDSLDSAKYALDNWDRLKSETELFADTLYGTTIPEPFIDAAGSCLSILKSPTCIRLEGGSFYAFEGCTKDAGCCEGSCTHVWNYAYAMPFLFPGLQRSMSDLDYKYNLNEAGGMPFRLMLPLGRKSQYRPCADGQFGNIIKVYREWKISGDEGWLLSIWPRVKKSLEYAWHPDNGDLWDPGQTGVLTGRQHHTLDMELFGPNSWLTSLYLVALKAASEMAEFADDLQSSKRYLEIFERGRKTLNDNLFNGEYFQQKVDLADRRILDSYTNSIGCAHQNDKKNVFDAYWNYEHEELKYQIGDGCAIDQILGQWHSNLIGLGRIVEDDKAITALQAIYRYNYKHNVRNHFNPCRIYCMEDEAGTVMCEWPTHKYKPWVPLTYSEETMHGFEYALAGQMIQYGLIEEATDVVAAVRDRYDGSNRNPWNEIECGSNYARSMAAFSFIQIFSGFSCDMTRGELAFSPRVELDVFQSFWAVGSAWGNITTNSKEIVITIQAGQFSLRSLRLPAWEAAEISISGKSVGWEFVDDRMAFLEKQVLKRGQAIKIKGKKTRRLNQIRNLTGLDEDVDCSMVSI